MIISALSIVYIYIFLLISEHEEEAGLFYGTVMAMLRGQRVIGVAFRDEG